MPTHRRRDLLSRRRRHDEEAEEDGSTVADVEDVSSEGSLTTDAEEDGDNSAKSGDEDNAQSVALSPVVTKQEPTAQPDQAQKFKTTADTEAMLNGLKLQDGNTTEELNFDSVAAGDSIRDTQAATAPVQPARLNRNQPDVPPNPAARKGYFYHDDRSRAMHNSAPFNIRGRGRGSGPPMSRGNFGSLNQTASKPWTHDLHETINQPTLPQPAVPSQPVPGPGAPNRSFSTTTVLGNVPVNVSIPGTEKNTSAHMVKKHYTLLPQHRPPLRRDKPVRISIPDEYPRYIFPSAERSFIFIPRAMRPNQMQRGRGRGSFHGSRRTSMATYSPSIGMSRRPSVAASNAGSGIHTPTAPGFQKPIVRMPAGIPFVAAAQHTEVYLGDDSAIIHSPPATLPMHQPIPQKTISMTGIESPAVQAPAQQTQQPFHQQIPQQNMPHIPEGAVYAQPFQPYPQPYYGMPYPQAPMMMQSNYDTGMESTVMSSRTGEQQGPVAHESNGMVFYYDPSQQYGPPMMNLMPMQTGPYFYPPVENQMFFQ